MKILVTGGAGFIGSNFVRRTLQDAYPGLEGAEVVVLDALTYSGNLANLAPVADSPRYTFVKGDIRDGGLLDELFPTVDAVVHFAAESHVDRSVARRVDLRRDERARHAAAARRGPAQQPEALRPRLHRRGLRLDRRGLVGGGPPARAELALLGVEGRQRPARAQLLPHARPQPVDHALLEQLRAVPLPREGHPAVRHEPDRRQARPAVRRGQQHPRLAARRRPHPRHRDGAGERPRRRDLQHRRRHRAHQQGADPAAARRHRQGLVVRRPRRRPPRSRPALLGRHLARSSRSSATSRSCRSSRASPTSCSGTATTAPGGSR